MLTDLPSECGRAGLLMHMGKTTVLSNGIGPNTRDTYVKVNDQTIDILPTSESSMCLGRALNLRAAHETEVNHRVNRA
eukprot:9669612-Karenia_brevis.AAC.1